jgi:hypothetical protein
MNWHTDKDTNLPKIEFSNGFEYSLREDRDSIQQDIK